MEQIDVSDCTSEKFSQLKQELYGGEIENDTALFLLCEEILNEGND